MIKPIIALCLCIPFLGFAQDSTVTSGTSSCPVSDSIKTVKKAPKGLPERAQVEAENNAACVPVLWQNLGEKSATWKKIRKSVLDKQPAAFTQLYGVRKLPAEEQKRVFFSTLLKDSALCNTFVDSIGLEALSGKDWIHKTTPWDTTGFGCKPFLETRILPKLDSVLTDTTQRRAKILAYFPEAWYKHYGESATAEELARYATNPALRDSSHCGLIDGATAEQLVRLGTPDNACKPFITERWGDLILRLTFRKNYKPQVLVAVNKRLAAANEANLDSLNGLIDTLEVIFADGEYWDVSDSLEAALLRMISKHPQAIHMMKDPTAPMLLTAFDNKLNLLCDYADNINDRLIVKLIGDRVSNDKPMPTTEELAALASCLPADLMNALTRAVQPYLNP